ncbi:MAG: pyridoxal-phosphate dependent enzyme [Myxococcales bacterium]|nr:pyridoxal-phosphate dependent enzyme [Myxococcales bacterium]
MGALTTRPGEGPRAPSGHALAGLLGRPPPCLRLADLPTPVERAAWLDRGDVEVWLKRDDRSSEIYGGGKVRKLEWLLANPPFNGRGPIASIGGIGSHHLVALALYLRGLDRRLHALTFEQVVTPHVEANLATRASLGVEFWHARTRAGLGLAWLAYKTWRRPAEPGVMMAPGASTGLGGFGFVGAGLELAAQIRAGLLPKPGTIYITGGSAGSSAGLAVGLALAEVGAHLRIVSAVEAWSFNGLLYRRMIRQIVATLAVHGLDPARLRGGADRLLADAGVTWSIDHTQVGPGYAVPTDAGRAAVAFAGDHGIKLETTYTGKCLAGLSADLAAGAAIRGPVLLWNTHGCNDLTRWQSVGWERRLPGKLRARLPALRGG